MLATLMGTAGGRNSQQLCFQCAWDKTKGQQFPESFYRNNSTLIFFLSLICLNPLSLC